MEGLRYGLQATWHVEPLSAADIGKKFLQTLDLIAEAVPKIEWLTGERPYEDSLVSIDQLRSGIAEWVEDHVAVIDGIKEPEYGYYLGAFSRRGLLPDNIVLSAAVGGKFGCRIRFEVGFVQVPSDLDTVTYPLFRAAMLAIIAEWPSVWANAYVYWQDYHKALSAPGGPAYPRSTYNVPWLSYLCAPLTKGLVPPVGVPCERTPDGGLLMVAAEERLDPTNPDHMRRARAMAEVMIARAGNPSRPGHWPLYEQWPPTPEMLRRRGPPAV